MKFRRIVSLTSMHSFIVLSLTGLIMYITPHGRTAYWTNWTLIGLSKDDLSVVHDTTGLLFFVASLLHIYLNWKPIVQYLKSKTKRVTFFTRENSVALALTLVVTLGTFFRVPPFSQFLGALESVKDSWEHKLGAPPYGHAELSSLQTLCKRTGISATVAQKKLRDRGIVFTGPDQRLKDIASANNMSPADVFAVFATAAPSEPAHQGDAPKVQPGTGRMTLEAGSAKYGFDLSEGLRRLKAKGVDATADTTFKQVSDKMGTTPADVVYLLTAKK